MKKFLVILMLVAMASFVFTGCLPTAPEVVEEEEAVEEEEEEAVEEEEEEAVEEEEEEAVEEEEEEEVVAPVSATPVLTAVETSAAVSIFTVTSTSALYMNKTELGTSILVKGTAPSESRVQIYLDGVAVAAAVGETSTSGLWTIAIAKSSLGDDGVKVMTAKVTEVGLAEGEASNAVTFTLDTDLPGIDSVAFTVVGDLAAATFTIVNTGTGEAVSNLLVNAEASGTLAPVQSITAGTWFVQALRASTETNNIAITTPGGVTTTHSIFSNAVVSDILIPGIKLTFGNISVNRAVASVKISSVTAATAAVKGRATIKFDEAVSYTGMAKGTYTCGGVTDDPGVYNETSDTGYFTNETTLTGSSGTSYTITVYGVEDLAGNVGGTAASPLTKSASAGAASSTSLAP